MKNPEQKEFDGVFICYNVWTHKDLDCTERCLIAEIDALSTEARPCWASNEKLGASVGVSEGRVRHVLTRLQELGIIRRLGFHRVFVERVVDPKFSFRPAVSKKWIEQYEAESKKKKKKQDRVVENDNASPAIDDHPSPATDSHPDPSPAINSRRARSEIAVEPGYIQPSSPAINSRQRGNKERKNSERKNKERTSSSSSRERSTVSGSDAGTHDDDKVLVAREGGEEALASDNGKNGHAAPEHDADGVTPEEKAKLMVLLTEDPCHVTRDVAEALIRDFDAEHIRDHVEAFKCRLDNGEVHNGGWLVESIRKGYEFPPGFKSCAQLAAQQEKREADAIAQQKRLDAEAEVRRLDEQAYDYMEKLPSEEFVALEAAAEREVPTGPFCALLRKSAMNRMALERLGLTEAKEQAERLVETKAVAATVKRFSSTPARPRCY